MLALSCYHAILIQVTANQVTLNYMEQYPDYRAEVYNQEEIEAKQKELDEQMTYEKRLEEAEDRDRDIYEQEVTELE